MNILETIQADLRGLNETPRTVHDTEPDQSVGDNETVLGDAPQIARDMWALERRYARIGATATVEAIFTKDPAFIATMSQAKAKVDIVNSMMWLSLREHFQCWGGTIGMRSGWKVVGIPAADPLTRLFGLNNK